MLNRVTFRHIALGGLLLACAILAIFYLQNDQRAAAFIRPYEEKDFQPLVTLMNENKYWIAESPNNFSPEKMLLYRAPGNDPNKKGLATVDVMESQTQTAGFIAYYNFKKNQEHGFIWLLGVDKNFRGQGFGEMLVTHALQKLKKQGAQYVTLGTRLINKPALKLYEKMGFVEHSRDEDRGMITLIKKNL